MKPKDFENFSHGDKKDSQGLDGRYPEKAGSKPRMEETGDPSPPDCGSIMNLHHFGLSSLIQHLASHCSMYACASLASAAATSFCSSSLLSPSYPRTLTHATLSTSNASLPPCHTCMLDLFIVRSQSNVTSLSCLKDPSASHSLLYEPVLLSL